MADRIASWQTFVIQFITFSTLSEGTHPLRTISAVARHAPCHVASARAGIS